MLKTCFYLFACFVQANSVHFNWERAAAKAGGNSYSKYTRCLPMDAHGNRMQYRYYCEEGKFHVQVSPCNYLDDKWIIRFSALDRLGGCTNVIHKRRPATIKTYISTCDTVFDKTDDGYVIIENKLHVFRNIEDIIFDETTYPLSCSYKEVTEFEYDLTGVDAVGYLDQNLSLKFWTDSSYKNQLPSRRFRVGEGVFFSLSWNKKPFKANYVIQKCYWNDKTAAKSFDIIRDGCVSGVVKAEQYSAYSESVESDHKFFFKAFAFSKDSNKIAMTCQIRMCLIGEEDCNRSPTFCPSGYKMGIGEELIKRK